MGRKKRFSVYLSEECFKLGLASSLLFAFIIALQVFVNKESVTFLLMGFSPGFLIAGYLMIKSKFYRIMVCDEIITVKTIFGKYSFHVSEIVEVRWQVTINQIMKAEKICIIAKNRKKIKLETVMYGMEKMKDYLIENVEEDKIKKKYIRLYAGDKSWEDHQSEQQ